MVRIVYTDNQIRASGHANYEEHGKDIVCAAVSTLLYTLATTGTMETIKDTTTVKSQDKKAVKLVLDGLKLIAEEYPQNVEVIECHT
ncbi:MAG: ribosomal-processing cysteine protease Prp [Aminipila sp.]